jgi:hypothetical protein
MRRGRETLSVGALGGGRGDENRGGPPSWMLDPEILTVSKTVVGGVSTAMA